MGTDNNPDQPNLPEASALVAHRGWIKGRTIAIPFLLMTVAACGLSCFYLWQERPLFSLFTLGLYACAWFLGNGYREAWVHQNYVRQLLALVVVALILSALALLHADDASRRIIYEGGTRYVREERVTFYIASGLDILAATILTIHGLGLGFGSRIYDQETGQRVSHNVAREVYHIARERIAEATEDHDEDSDDNDDDDPGERDGTHADEDEDGTKSTVNATQIEASRS